MSSCWAPEVVIGNVLQADTVPVGVYSGLKIALTRAENGFNVFDPHTNRMTLMPKTLHMLSKKVFLLTGMQNIQIK